MLSVWSDTNSETINNPEKTAQKLQNENNPTVSSEKTNESLRTICNRQFMKIKGYFPD